MSVETQFLFTPLEENASRPAQCLLEKKFLKNKKDGRCFAAKDAAKDTEEYTINTWKIERAKKKQEWRKRNNDIKARIKKESGNIDPELKKFSPYKKERQVKKLFKKKKVGRYFHAEDAGKNTDENTIKSRMIEKAKRIQDLKKRNDENKAGINKESGDNDPGLKKSSPYKKDRQVKKLVIKKKVGRYFNAEDAGKNNEGKTTKSWKIERVKKKQEWRKRNDDKKARINKESGENDPELKKSSPNKKEREVKKKDFIRKRKPHQKHDKRQKGEDDTMENKRDPVSGPKPIPKKTIRKHERGEGIRNKKDFIRKRKPHQKHDKRQKGDDTMENKRDPFPGPKPIPKETIRKYERGEGIRNPQTKSEFESKLLKRKEEKLKYVAKQAARAELIMQEESGFLRAEENEDTEAITQLDIADVVDVTSAQKFFELKMNDFGPYRINYTRNGRFLLFGGAKGHVAAIDWMTKKLLCEINVMETLHDVRWLHQETMYAVAQKQWTYIYDNQGIELHCLKVLDRVLRMEFLPYHFLLATANVTGYLSYIDVSVGEKVAGYSTQMGRLDVMCQNPSNAVIHLGHTGGTVSLWCPKVKEPLMKMLCHGSGVRSIAIDKTGQYMASSGIDRTLKIWDLRTYKTLQSYKLGGGAGQLAFSQTGLLAAGLGNIVQVYQDCIRQTVTKPYMVHNLTSSVNSLQFCPYEDVLGVGHGNGFSSLIIPGAGEANFDALEANPYQTKKQRREAEVKMLLDKIPADMIHIDSGIIGRVDQKTLQDKMEERNKNILFKPQKKDFQPKYKMKGRSKTGKYEQRKKGVIEQDKRTQIKERVRLKQKEEREKQQNETRTLPSGNVLDRFKRKET